MIDDPRLPAEFWANVSPEPNTGCWLWTGTIVGEFGRFKTESGWKPVHQIVFRTLIGEREGYSRRLFHRCDEKTCCNPEHVFAHLKFTPERRREYLNEWQRTAVRTRPEYREKRLQSQRRAYWRDPRKAIETQRAWQAKNRDMVRAMGKRWREANPEKVARLAHRRRLKKYGLTEGRYDLLIDKQGNACAICRAAFILGVLKDVHIDHCHRTGVVRGLLCSRCNLGIGLFKDDHERLSAAAEYVKTWRGNC